MSQVRLYHGYRNQKCYTDSLFVYMFSVIELNDVK